MVEAAAVSHGRMSFYLPIVDMLRRFFDVQDGDESNTVQERIVTYVSRLDESLREAVAPMLFLLEALPESHAFRAPDPGERRRRILAAMARALPHFAAICTEGLFKCRELKGLREVNPLPSTSKFLAELELVFS